MKLTGKQREEQSIGKPGYVLYTAQGQRTDVEPKARLDNVTRRGDEVGSPLEGKLRAQPVSVLDVLEDMTLLLRMLAWYVFSLLLQQKECISNQTWQLVAQKHKAQVFLVTRARAWNWKECMLSDS